MKAFSLSFRSMKVMYALLIAALILLSLNMFGLPGEAALEELFGGKPESVKGR